MPGWAWGNGLGWKSLQRPPSPPGLPRPPRACPQVPHPHAHPQGWHSASALGSCTRAGQPFPGGVFPIFLLNLPCPPAPMGCRPSLCSAPPWIQGGGVRIRSGVGPDLQPARTEGLLPCSKPTWSWRASRRTWPRSARRRSRCWRSRSRRAQPLCCAPSWRSPCGRWSRCTASPASTWRSE